ncbi:1-phosphatidylinositol phosphodiesterase [Ceratocystis lukuohia]|uniref:1-phosphatidylinositol phosphodiesterase n=1 Tax=Ceratocystis lukuohia TaxID=2019550 RepID=A0ABR4MA50_9PEZI
MLLFFYPSSFFESAYYPAFGHAGIFKEIDDMWSFDLDEGRNADWMDTIEDDVFLTDLSIPGTHNSMTYTVASGLAQTQNVPLAEQLIAGIRYIDISCRYINHKMMVYNGLTDTGYSLQHVLTTLFDFLNEHPSEAVILRIQKGGILDDSNKFLRSMDRHFLPSFEFGDLALDYIYSRDTNEDTIPTLGEVRGKVLILQDFKTSPPGRYGIPWNSHTVSSYNHRLTAGTLLLKLRWARIKSHLSRGRSKDLNKLRITHTTASAGVKPISFSTRHYDGFGINRLLGRYLSLGRGKCFGVVVMDFPGYYLVNHILMLNEEFQVPEATDFSSNLGDVPAAEVYVPAEEVHVPTAEVFDFSEVYDGDTPHVEASDDEASDYEVSDGDDGRPSGLAR